MGIISERGILQTSISKYIMNLDTNELTFVDEYLSYDDNLLDIKEKNQENLYQIQIN